ncbi:DUF2167 domain-containing protein [Paenibacillus sp. UNC451MF]|uniref:DUF2167 domain-containing protein n=1 Tax=Paenibacillus sp. UNC451MF TaxID=1449063 RepID=UPI00048C4D2F|nr:DUF2167 domain-containing protein [Paenibacillus sp. UNC451MF]
MKKRLLGMTLALTLICSTAVSAAESKFNWIEGGKKVDLKQIATLDLDPSFVFLDAANTMKMSKESHETPSGKEIGSVYPTDEKQNWAVIFEYDNSGHIKDDEKQKIDAKAILKSYKKGTEEANKEKEPGQRLYVTGWDVEPFYDEKSHNLTWSMLAEDDNKEQLLNYNVRLLTREGYISAILVSDPEHREADKKVLTEKILPKLEMQAGKRYEDFDASKDKVSEYGLSALILGGAGLAVAKKVGLLATIALLGKKFGIVIIAAFGVLIGFIRKLFGRKKAEPVQTLPQDQQENTPTP